MKYINIRPEWSKSRSQRMCLGPLLSHIAACHSAALQRPGLPAAGTAVQSGSCCPPSPLCCLPTWMPPPPCFSWVALCSTSFLLSLPPWSRLRRRRNTLQNEELWIYLEMIICVKIYLHFHSSKCHFEKKKKNNIVVTKSVRWHLWTAQKTFMWW